MATFAARLFALTLAVASPCAYGAGIDGMVDGEIDVPVRFLMAEESVSATVDTPSTSVGYESAFPSQGSDSVEPLHTELVGWRSLTSSTPKERWMYLLFDAESLFLRFNSMEGTRRSVFDFETASRYSLGFVTGNGLGFRATYFEYDDLANDVGGVGQVAFDTYNMDFEIFKRLQLTTSTKFEIGGGMRYNETNYFRNGPTNFSNFRGIGVVLGVKGSTTVFTGGAIYGRARGSILSGEGSHEGNSFNGRHLKNIGRSQFELGFGYEHPVQVGVLEFTPRLGAEMQHFGGYGIDPVDEQPDADLYLAGFLVGMDVRF